MADKHLSNEEFLTRLTTLLRTTHTKNHGSVFLTQKPISIRPSSTTSVSQQQQQEQQQEQQPTQILIRATNGKSKTHRERTSAGVGGTSSKEKLSTIVDFGSDGSGSGLEEFYRRYAEVCKKGMEGLRKRDRKKGKKKRERGKKGGAGGAAGQKEG